MRSLTLIIAAIAVAWPVAGQAREARHLQPSSKWVVNYSDDSCTLSRSFGEDDHKVTLFLEQFVPGDTFTMTLVGKPLARSRADDVTVRFGPNEVESEESGVAATTQNIPAVILHGPQRLAPLTEAERAARKSAIERNESYDPPPIGSAREKAATWIQFGKFMRFDLVLETGPLDEAFAALRECAWDTIKTWGLDIEQQKRLRRKAYPTNPSESWFNDSDYPAAMAQGGYEAIVNFRVLVDPTGRATSCHIQSSTRPKAFDDVVCGAIMRRARFRPALDADGKPVTSYWRQTVTFRLAE